MFSVCLQIPTVVLTTYVVLSCVDTRSHSHEVEMHTRPELFLSRVICATSKKRTNNEATKKHSERKERTETKERGKEREANGSAGW